MTRMWSVTREQGLSVLEAIVAVLLLAVALLAAAGVLSLATTHAALGRQGTEAASLAAQEVDRLRDLPFDAIPIGTSQEVRLVDGRSYRLTRTVTPDDPGPNMKRVVVVVEWDLLGPRVYRTEVVLTDLQKPVPTPSPTPPGGGP